MPQQNLRSDIKGAARDVATTTLDAASDAAETAKSAVASVTSRAKESASELGEFAGEALHTTAKYVRSHGAKDIMSDVQELVKGNPGKSMIAAVAAGFLLGRSLSRRD